MVGGLWLMFRRPANGASSSSTIIPIAAAAAGGTQKPAHNPLSSPDDDWRLFPLLHSDVALPSSPFLFQTFSGLPQMDRLLQLSFTLLTLSLVLCVCVCYAGGGGLVDNSSISFFPNINRHDDDEDGRKEKKSVAWMMEWSVWHHHRHHPNSYHLSLLGYMEEDCQVTHLQLQLY